MGSEAEEEKWKHLVSVLKTIILDLEPMSLPLAGTISPTLFEPKSPWLIKKNKEYLDPEDVNQFL